MGTIRNGNDGLINAHIECIFDVYGHHQKLLPLIVKSGVLPMRDSHPNVCKCAFLVESMLEGTVFAEYCRFFQHYLRIIKMIFISFHIHCTVIFAKFIQWH